MGYTCFDHNRFNVLRPGIPRRTFSSSCQILHGAAAADCQGSGGQIKKPFCRSTAGTLYGNSLRITQIPGNGTGKLSLFLFRPGGIVIGIFDGNRFSIKQAVFQLRHVTQEGHIGHSGRTTENISGDFRNTGRDYHGFQIGTVGERTFPNAGECIR